MHVAQDEALKSIARTLDQRKEGWFDETRPLVFLLTGPSRIGKTESAEQISRIIANKPLDSRAFLNMGQYQSDQDVAKLNGSGPGFVGSPDGALAFLGKSCEHVVILDEIEKACTKVLDFFLSVFDKGQFATGDFREVDCKSAVFVMTSNIGSELLEKKADLIRQLSIESHQAFGNDELMPLFLARGWRKEFWNRVSVCVPFLPLSEQSYVIGARHFLRVSQCLLHCDYHIIACACFCQVAACVVSGQWLIIAFIVLSYYSLLYTNIPAFCKADAKWCMCICMFLLNRVLQCVLFDWGAII